MLNNLRCLRTLLMIKININGKSKLTTTFIIYLGFYNVEYLNYLIIAVEYL